MRLDLEIVKKFYGSQRNVWPEDNEYYAHSRKEILRFIHNYNFSNKDIILNLGSGGNDYGLKNLIHHVDIVDNKISNFPLYTVSNIEKLPFSEAQFSNIICVGSVLNYCNAVEAISEISRVSTHGCKLIIEFECSNGLEYLRKPFFCLDAAIAMLTYCDENHTEWLYSEEYILKILKAYSFQINEIHRFHYVSSFLCGLMGNENFSGHAAKLDPFVRAIPLIKKFAGNVILSCEKY